MKPYSGLLQYCVHSVVFDNPSAFPFHIQLFLPPVMSGDSWSNYHIQVVTSVVVLSFCQWEVFHKTL